MFAWFINNLANVFPMILFSFYISTFLVEMIVIDKLFFSITSYLRFLGVPFWTYISKKFGKKKLGLVL